MKRHLIFPFMMLALAFGGCSRPSEFQSVPIKVVDENTGAPVVGAAVKSICMGGTPYATNVYRTDAQGVAQVMVNKAGEMVRAEAVDYEPGFGNMVVRLKKKP